MTRRSPLFLLIIVVLSLAGLGLAYPPAQRAHAAAGGFGENDAASGQDAGDTPHQALLLSAAPRTWSANLRPPGTDADWYTLGASGAFCAAVETTMSAPGQVTLSATTARDPAVARSVSAHSSTRLSLAAPAGHAPYFGVEPIAMLMAAEQANPGGPGQYAFALSSRSHADLDPEGDGESPEAGGTLATAAPLVRGCAAGRLDAGLGDAEDVYFFDVSDPRQMTFSFALSSGEPASARIVTPSGATYATLASGDAVDVWASEAGRWHVAVAQTAAAPPALVPLAWTGLALAQHETLASDYLLSTTDGPGEPQPCRPACME